MMGKNRGKYNGNVDEDVMFNLNTHLEGFSMGEEDDNNQVDHKEIDKVIANVIKDTNTNSVKNLSAENSKVADVHDNCDLVGANRNLQQAIKAVRLAVSYDERNLDGFAAQQYVLALESFSDALDCGYRGSKNDADNTVLRSMIEYVDRVQHILVNQTTQADPSIVKINEHCIPYPDVFRNRVKIFKSMVKAGCSCVSRGVELRRKAIMHREKDMKWHAFIYFSESIDCFVACLGTDLKPSSTATIKKSIIDMLDCAEKLKKEL